ncbi:MAG TPA: TorF family putative porin [Rhizomicrobium sp.]
MKDFTMKLFLGAASVAGLVATTAPAMADDDWGTLSGYVDVQSDYRFRGISQNDREWAPQASINWSGPDGFYAGTWVSKINWTGVAFLGSTPSLETDFYGGKHFDLGGTDLNVEAYYYAYPDFNKPKFFLATGVLGEASYLEGIVQLSHSFGDLALTVTGAVSPQFSLGGGVGEYIEGTASYPLLDWLSVSANVGHQWVDLAPSDYTHFDLGLTATWRHWALDVRANGTDMGTITCGFYMVTANACTTGVVATLTYNIPDILNP